MTDIVSVYAIFGNDEEARRIARIVIEERLAACANILAPCHSIYRWRGKVEEAPEVPAIFKTRAERALALIDRIGSLHSYDVPAAVAWPIAAALESYQEWVVEET
jgi:periplasmic divalent cation tolerance protein